MLRPTCLSTLLVRRYIITIEGPGFTDVQDVELLGLPDEGDPIETKYGECIVTATEVLPEGRHYDGKIFVRMP